MTSRAALAAALFLSVAASAASAADWKTLPGSTLGFGSSMQGEAFTGRFARFTPVLRFDPAQLPASRLDVSIDLASVETKNAERDEGLKSMEFFNTKSQPKARYVATTFRALGGGRYVADGTLTLNGHSKAVPLAFTWTGGAKPVLAGSATVNRLDFGVGTGDWEDTGLLPNAVKVTTRLVLAPAK